MRIELDCHTHSFASVHAYNTMTEMIQAAADKGLKLYALTEHAPAMPGSCGNYYFYNYKILPRIRNGIEVMYGVELNIMDYKGRLDLPVQYIQSTDLRIASLHTPCIKPGTVEENTSAVFGAIHSPYVDILGHMDDGRFPLDYEKVVSEAKKFGKIIELNNSSLSPLNSRTFTRENDILLLEKCREYEVPVIMGSDSHADFQIGVFDDAINLIEEIDFPRELIVNDSVEKFKKYLAIGRELGKKL